MTANRPRSVEPAGGTTTPFVRWTSGAFCFLETDDDDRDDRHRADGPREGVPTLRRGGPDLRALAGRRRVRARRDGLDGRSGRRSVRDHPAAAERHRLAPPRACPAIRGRGPDDPPRPAPRAAGPVPARARPCLDRRPGRPRPDHRRRGRDAPEPRPRAVPRADAPVRRRDQAGDAPAAAPRRRLARLGTAPVHDGRDLRQGGSRGVPASLSRRPRVPDRGPHQLVPQLPHEPVGPRGHRDARDGHALERPLPPHR